MTSEHLRKVGRSVPFILHLYHLQKGRCLYCQGDLVPSLSTWEHVIPQSWGGDNSPFNLRLSCRQCNLMKSKVENSALIRKKRSIPMEEKVAHFIQICATKAIRHKDPGTGIRYYWMAHHILEAADQCNKEDSD